MAGRILARSSHHPAPGRSTSRAIRAWPGSAGVEQPDDWSESLDRRPRDRIEDELDLADAFAGVGSKLLGHRFRVALERDHRHLRGRVAHLAPGAARHADLDGDRSLDLRGVAAS